MSTKKPSSREFVERLDLLDAATPEDAEEINATLESFGFRADQVARDAISRVTEFERKQRDARLAAAAAKRQAEVVRLRSRPKVLLDDATMRTQLARISARAGGEQLQFKDLKACSHEELQSLLDEFGHLEDGDERAKK